MRDELADSLAPGLPLSMRLTRTAFAFFAVFLLAILAVAGPASAIPRLLVDMNNGEVLYAEEAGQPWHPASLTKLMTAYVTFNAIDAGRIGLTTPVIMSARAVREPPSRSGLPKGEAITLKDALYLMIVKSANDVAVAIAETVGGSVEDFVFEMNSQASALGLTATHYANPNGLDDPEQITSARDLAVLAMTIRTRYPQYAGIFATERVLLGKVSLRSHNDLLTRLAGTTGMKTGFICSSGLNIVATVERGGRSLMAVVLGSSSARERGELTGEMVEAALGGRMSGTGRIVSGIANSGGPPTDMRSLLCGKEAKAYVAARRADYPYGLKGEDSFLNDTVAPREYRAVPLGQLRNVPLPRPRPLWAPAPVVAAAQAMPLVPLPRPRPSRLQ